MCIVKILVACLFIGIIAAQNGLLKDKDAIGFPEVEENSNSQNKENRQPVYLPSTCPENELYYPGDQKDDWICDCKPANIYHPASDKCWPAYRKGPCKEGYFLVLPHNSVLPVCEINVCYVDNYVIWDNKCEKIGSAKPCDHMFPTSAALGVNATTLVVSCVRQGLSFDNRFGDGGDVYVKSPTKTPQVPEVLCPPGCKRSYNGVCVPERL